MQGFNETFGLDRDESYWRWKFCGSGTPMVMLAVDAAGAVQAQFAGIPAMWEAEGKTLLVAQICDLFSRRHPEVIRERVMLKTLQAFHDHYRGRSGMSMVFGFPNRIALHLHHSVLPAFTSTDPVSTYAKKVGKPVTMRCHGGCSVRRALPGTDSLDSLWQRAKKRYDLASVRNARWFYWRFRDRPDVDDYSFLSIVRDDNLATAMAVVRPQGNTLWVCDLLWDGGGCAGLEMLDNAISLEAEKHGCHEKAIWLQGDRCALEVLESLGWKDRTRAQNVYMAMYLYDETLDPGWVYSGLYLTLADSDLI